jgi:hypothetical protein
MKRRRWKTGQKGLIVLESLKFELEVLVALVPIAALTSSPPKIRLMQGRLAADRPSRTICDGTAGSSRAEASKDR